MLACERFRRAGPAQKTNGAILLRGPPWQTATCRGPESGSFFGHESIALTNDHSRKRCLPPLGPRLGERYSPTSATRRSMTLVCVGPVFSRPPACWKNEYESLMAR